MLGARAKGILCKDVYPDVIRGMAVAETIADEPRQVIDVEVEPLRPASAGAPAPAVQEGDHAETRVERWERELRAAKNDAEGGRVKDEILKALKTGDPDRKRLAALYTERKSTGWPVPSPVDVEPDHDPTTGEVIEGNPDADDE
jgi:hypothetical protein